MMTHEAQVLIHPCLRCGGRGYQGRDGDVNCLNCGRTIIQGDPIEIEPTREGSHTAPSLRDTGRHSHPFFAGLWAVSGDHVDDLSAE